MKILRHIIAIVYLVSAARLGSVWAEGGGKGSIRGKSDGERRLKPLFVPNAAGGNGQKDKSKFRKAPVKGIPGQYIVVLQDAVKDKDIEALADSLAASNNGQRKGNAYRRVFKGFAVRMREADAMALSEMAEVKYVEQDAVVTKNIEQRDATWGLDRIDQRFGGLDLDSTYSYGGKEGEGVTAYILDTGIRTTHDEFGVRVEWGTNTADKRDRDCDGHGTHGM